MPDIPATDTNVSATGASPLAVRLDAPQTINGEAVRYQSLWLLMRVYYAALYENSPVSLASLKSRFGQTSGAAGDLRMLISRAFSDFARWHVAVGWGEDRLTTTFQSRFGKAEWLQPYTQPTLEALARAGTGRVDVICPGFVADCLETLEEIAMECKAAFLACGGREFHYIPCLNERADWMDGLHAVVRRHLGHWLDQPAASAAERADSRARALALGATDR